MKVKYLIVIIILAFSQISCGQGLKETDIINKVKELTETQIKNGSFSGALLIANKDKILYTACSGEANKSFHVPNNTDTKFNLGSMNKMFTSTAIMKLIEEGKLTLKDPISKYIDETWLPKEITSKIRIEHLLSHSSGLGSYFNKTFMNSSRALYRDLNDYKPLVKDEKLQFEPGSKWAYSNTGMFILGVIIEKVTGQNYFDYIRKTIYEPAGMANSDSYEMDLPVENLAIGYTKDDRTPEGWRNNLYMHVIKGGPAGGGFSTVKDLHKFALALLSEKYVGKKTLTAMWTNYFNADYGYGFMTKETSIGKVVGHTGGFPGINSVLEIYVDAGYIVAVMSNNDTGAVELAREIRGFLTKK
jgi:CubicO group peptidase (beta-lactamase class C family)